MHLTDQTANGCTACGLILPQNSSVSPPLYAEQAQRGHDSENQFGCLAHSGTENKDLCASGPFIRRILDDKSFAFKAWNSHKSDGVTDQLANCSGTVFYTASSKYTATHRSACTHMLFSLQPHTTAKP